MNTVVEERRLAMDLAISLGYEIRSTNPYHGGHTAFPCTVCIMKRYHEGRSGDSCRYDHDGFRPCGDGFGCFVTDPKGLGSELLTNAINTLITMDRAHS